MNTHELTQAIAVDLLQGRVLQASKVSAGRGTVIDWRHVPSGETCLDGADAFDTASLFLALVGWGAAAMALDPGDDSDRFDSYDLAGASSAEG